MFNTQRFLYDADAPVSPAAAMAAQGVRVDAGNPTTLTNPEPTAQPEPAVVAPPDANIAAPESTPAEPVAEPQKPVDVPASIAEKPWQEVLKSQTPEAIYKELGVDPEAVKLAQKLKTTDPKMLALFNTWESKGNVKEYLEALSVDYKEMAPEDVMRQDLRARYPKMSKEEFSDLVDIKIIDRYKLDPERFTEDEVRRGKVELKADSEAIRDNLIAQQNDKLLPPPPEAIASVDPRVAAYEAKEAQQVELVTNYKKDIYADPYIRSVVTDKKITIGEGPEAFNYLVKEPEKALSFLYDANAAVQALQTEGKHDFKKSALIASFSTDPYGFIQELAKHYKELGGKEIAGPLENASLPGQTAARPEIQPTSAAQAMAMQGTRSR